jgi:hypothetical protein
VDDCSRTEEKIACIRGSFGRFAFFSAFSKYLPSVTAVAGDNRAVGGVFTAAFGLRSVPTQAASVDAGWAMAPSREVVRNSGMGRGRGRRMWMCKVVYHKYQNFR